MNEHTPLLPTQRAPPLPPKPPSPTGFLPVPADPPPEPPHIHILPPSPGETLSLPAIAHFAAALKAGHLPSTEQLLALLDLVLEFPLLDDGDEDNGTVWDPTYGEGRLGTGRLTREGERVRLAAREGVWSLRELLEGRNPVVKREKGGSDLVGETDQGEAGDGWQEFLWRCRNSQVDVHVPTAHVPNPSSDDLDSFRSSLFTFLQLFLTSPDLRALLSDLVLLFRDTVDVVIETAEKRDHYLKPGASQALQQLVTGVTEKVVGEGAVEDHDEKEHSAIGGLSYAAAVAKPPPQNEEEKVEIDVSVTLPPGAAVANDPPEVEIQLNGEVLEHEEEYEPEEEQTEAEQEYAPDPPEEAVPPVPPQKSPEQVKDAFVDRLKEILVHLQATDAYQRSVRTLLSLFRSYLVGTIEDAKLSASLHPTPVHPTAPSPGENGPPTPPETPPFPESARIVEIEDDEDGSPGDPTELLIPLLEPFTGGAGSLSPLREALHALLSHLTPLSPAASSSAKEKEKEQDTSTIPSRLNDLATSLDRLLTKSLLVPGWLGSSESYRALSSVYDQLQHLGEDAPALRADFAQFLSLTLDAFGNVANDPLLARALGATEELGKALAGWAEAAGETAVRATGGEGVAAVWGDVVEWIVPRLLGVLKEVPLPRIEFASPSVDLAIDPPSLLSTSFIPSSLSIRTSTALTYLPTLGSSSLALPPSASHTVSPTLTHASAAARTSYAASTAIEVDGLRLEVKNVGYHARYHSFLGDITESGLLDLHFGEEPKGGLSLSLATSTPSPANTRQTLFEVNTSDTHARLSHFSVTPHHSSHPLLMWMFRPIMRKAVKLVVEMEVRQLLLVQGAEWVGRKGYEVKEVKKRRDLDEEARGMRRAKGGKGKGGEEEETGEVWKWVGAVWEAFTGSSSVATIRTGEETDGEETTYDEYDGKSFEEDDEDEEERSGGALSWSLHLNKHGVAVDLERGPDPLPSSSTAPAQPTEIGTVGTGTEGVVLPAGSAPIPTSTGRRPKGLVRAANDEVRKEVREGQKAAREVMETVGEAGEVRDEWEGMVEAERADERMGRRLGWRSEAFDLR
ncbi:hypothetical protein JCM8547_000772 [Rhodosporidiobolus lusitaniae]